MSIHNKIVETAITFDDVLLIPSYSEVLPNQVSLKSRLLIIKKTEEYLDIVEKDHDRHVHGEDMLHVIR